MKKQSTWFFSVLFVMIGIQVNGQQPKTLQPATEEQQKQWPQLHLLKPSTAFAFQLSPGEVKSILSSSSHLELRDPKGNRVVMELERRDVLAPELGERYPEIAAWKGQADGFPVRLDLGSHGMHVQVLAPGANWYIDPIMQGDSLRYIAYYKNTAHNPHQFWCGVGETEAWDEGEGEERTTSPNGATLRTYRLALACTGEYAAYHGGTTGSVLSAMNTAINRVNGVYARELAVEMVLIPNNDLLIFFDGNTDPYSNNDGFLMLGENQTTINQIIGSANYDIGHVFSTGGGGIADLASVCTNNKAEGVTGLGNPIGDPFYIDYVAHEIGHQFNGSHTFNSSLGGCNGNRSSNNAYEPGSGSTIMAYAGLCGADNIANNSDDYFNVRNYQTMLSFLQGTGGSCAATSPTGNQAPVVLANATPQTFFPVETPFRLDATGSDPDNDTLSYCWEQYNRGPSVAINQTPTSGTPPLFVSLPPVAVSERWFPRLNFVVNNANSNLEKLPTYSRNMTFRVTVRDNKGGVSYHQIAYNATDQAGPFRVSDPNTVLSLWNVGTQVQVAWDVANTQSSPVNCSDVRIRLSTDGGYTYPHTLIAHTPNDGSESFVLANLPGEPAVITQARVMVESIGNIFYDISNANFTINNVLGLGDAEEYASGLYPNPSESGRFLLPIHLMEGSWQWAVYDLAGRSVPFRLNEGKEIQLENSASGIYFLQGASSTGSYRQRLVIP